MKSVITINEDSKTGGKKKIMERLGEFVGAKAKIDGNRSRASKQVSITDLLIFTQISLFL